MASNYDHGAGAPTLAAAAAPPPTGTSTAAAAAFFAQTTAEQVAALLSATPVSPATTDLSAFGSRGFTRDEVHRISTLLNTPLTADLLAERQGPSGSKLTYVEGWRCLDISNNVFGFNGWSCAVLSITVDFCECSGQKYTCCASAIVRVTLRDGTSHDDVGCGDARDASKAMAIERAKKAAVTDARKRALRVFGPGLGNSVYDKDYVRGLKNGPTPAPAHATTMPAAVAAPPPALAPPPVSAMPRPPVVHTTASEWLGTSSVAAAPSVPPSPPPAAHKRNAPADFGATSSPAKRHQSMVMPDREPTPPAITTSAAPAVRTTPVSSIVPPPALGSPALVAPASVSTPVAHTMPSMPMHGLSTPAQPTPAPAVLTAPPAPAAVAPPAPPAAPMVFDDAFLLAALVDGTEHASPSKAAPAQTAASRASILEQKRREALERLNRNGGSGLLAQQPANH